MTSEELRTTGYRSREVSQLLTAMRRRWLLIVLCACVGGAVAYVLSAVQQDQYSASASLLFRNPGFAEDLFGTDVQSSTTDPVREAATNVKLVGLRVVAELTAKKLGTVTPSEVSEMVSVGAEGEADVVSVTATSADPAQARTVANTFARQFIAFRANTDRSKLIEAKKLAERELARLSEKEKSGPRGQALSQGVEKLGILASLQTGNAELVQTADLPTSPSSPRPARNSVLGFFIGLLLGICGAVLSERLNRRLRDPEEAQAAFGLPVIGTVPESKTLGEDEARGPARTPPFQENEAFQMLRASLRYFNVDRNISAVLVTSYTAGAGKSTVSWNLARVAASSSSAVLLETDFRNPSLARTHGLAVAPGLAEVLTHQIELDEVIQVKKLQLAVSPAGEEPELHIITAGGGAPNPAELTESEAMTDILARLRERYDLVVVDTAPLGIVSDAFSLLKEVDGVIAVARMRQSTRDQADHLVDQLRRLNAPMLGIVANGVKMRRGSSYGYGYYGDPTADRANESVPRE